MLWRIRWCARWFGADRNPLRRRTDRIEGAMRLVLVLAFLVAGPMLASSVGRDVNAAGLRQARIERSWHQVNAILLKPAPQPMTAYGNAATYWVKGRWPVPGGGTRTGLIPTQAGARPGAAVAIWVNAAGRATGQPPVTSGVVVFRVVLAEIMTLGGLAIALFLLAALVRWRLNRRRLLNWAIEWAMVGPRWTSRR